MTTAPPKDCPCGRPRSGGTVAEMMRGEHGPYRVDYLHPDGSCVWTLLGKRWHRTFLDRAA